MPKGEVRWPEEAESCPHGLRAPSCFIGRVLKKMGQLHCHCCINRRFYIEIHPSRPHLVLKPHQLAGDVILLKKRRSSSACKAGSES